MRTPMGLLAIALLSLVTAGEVGAEERSPVKGGHGGGNFSDPCAKGFLLVGFGFRGGKALDRMTPYCKSVQNGKWSGSKFDERAPRGQENPDGPFTRGTVLCDRDQFVTSLHVWWDHFGIVHHIRVNCHSLDRKKESKAASWNTGGEPSQDEPTACPTGMFATGMYGRSGALIDAVGLICGAV
jgi:hypothetical protein